MKAKRQIITTFKIWIVIYPSITLFLFLFGRLLSSFPLVLRTFLLTIVWVPWIVFAGLPLLDYFIRSASSKKRTNR